MPDREEILASADPALAEAGRRGLTTCLGAVKDDTVTVVADEKNIVVGAAFLSAAIDAGIKTHAFLMEKHGKRPMKRFSDSAVQAIESSTVTVLAVTPQPGELKSRIQFIDLTTKHQIRHAHLVSVSPDALRMGMRADYNAVDALQERILEVLGHAGGVHVFSALGTNLDVTFANDHRWVRSNGLIKPGYWQNLPSGQVYTCPATCDGSYVADWSIGDWFEQSYPDLHEHPVTLSLSGGRLTSVSCPNRKLARELTLFTRSSKNGDRVGEIGFGTNPFLKFMKGQMVLNEDVPGVHLALGDPFQDKTGASWSSSVRVPLVGAGMSITAGDRVVMEEGVFAPDLLEGLPEMSG
ncbi:MAG: aminopeptidase [Deltaproteobacteria bacterium]|nr:aminopeptidase [Deltaproteobacteria bacterium]